MLRSIADRVRSVFAWWMNDIRRRPSTFGKAASLLIGLFVLCCACSFVFTALRSTGQAVGLVAPNTPTPAPTNTPLPTATPLPTNTPPPTDTPLPTNTPGPTDTPAPTNTPVAGQNPPPPPAPKGRCLPVAPAATYNDKLSFLSNL